MEAIEVELPRLEAEKAELEARMSSGTLPYTELQAASARIQALMKEVMAANEKVLADPEPFAQISGGTNEALEFTVRAWCETGKYWDVYFDLIERCSHALSENGIDDPEERIAVRVVSGENT